MAGPIATLTASMNLQLLVQQAYTTDPVIGNQGITGQPVLGRQLSFRNVVSLPTGVLLGTQVKMFTQVVGASGTATVDLSAATANVAGNVAATFAKIKGFLLWLPLTTEAPSLALSVQASSVTVGNNSGGSNQNVLCLNSTTDGIILNGGDMAAFLESSGHITVDGTHKSLLITNNDTVNAATVVIALVGTDT